LFAASYSLPCLGTKALFQGPQPLGLGAVFSFPQPTSRQKTIYSQQEEVMKIQPLNDRILVKRLEEEEKTAGGIIIPDSAKEKPAEGKVIAAGPGKLNDKGERVALQVKGGDRVLFSKYGGTDVKIDGENYLIMREDDVLGILR
jgi:chaperonin GroES